MAIELTSTLPSQPSTERARRTPLSYDAKNKLLAYGSGKQVVVRSVVTPEIAALVYDEHLQPVTTVSFSPSGFYIASGDQSGQVRIWNTSGDDTVTKGPYQATSARLNGIDWCSESQRVIAVGDGKERYGHGFTADTGNTIGEISGHSGEVHAVAIKPNRPMRAVTVGEDGNAVFYEGPPFRFARSVSPHTSAVSDVAYSPDGAHFVTGSCDRKVALYDGKTGDFVKWLDAGHEGMVLSVTFASPTLVLSASADCSVRLVDINSNKVVNIWSLSRELGHQQTAVVAAVGAHPSGNPEDLLVLSVGLNGNIYYWTRDSDKPLRVVQGHQKAVTALGINSANETVTGSVDGSVIQWSSKDGSGVRLDKAEHEGPVSGLVGDLWSAGWDSKIINIGDKSQVLTTAAQPLAVAKTGKYTVAVANDTVELVADANNGVEPRIAALSGTGTAIDAVGDLCAVGVGNRAELRELPSLKLIHTFDVRQSDISAVSISPDSKLVAVGEASGKITLYSAEGSYGMVTSRWTFHSSRVTSICWSKDSSRVVTGALDTNIFIYNVERPARNIKFLGAHKDGVTQVAWTSDNEFVSSGSDACVKKWKVSE